MQSTLGASQVTTLLIHVVATEQSQKYVQHNRSKHYVYIPLHAWMYLAIDTIDYVTRLCLIRVIADNPCFALAAFAS